jgi:haloalkane dehalogenase
MSAPSHMAGVDFTPSPELYPFESRYFDSSAGAVHYVDEGQGPPILLLHGNPTWSFLYRNVIGGLRDRLRCVAVDYLGFGLSAQPSGFGWTPAEHAEVIGELVRALDLRDLVIMGHDWGGPIGLSVASSAPDRIRGLVIGNTWFWAPDGPARAFSLVMSSPPMQWAISKRNFFVERIIPGGTRRDLSEQEMEHYRAAQRTPQRRAGVARFPREIRAAAPWLAELETAVRGELRDKPTLIVWPMKDVAFRFDRNVPRIREALPDSEVVQLPEAKHYFQEDDPNTVVRAILDRFG